MKVSTKELADLLEYFTIRHPNEEQLDYLDDSIRWYKKWIKMNKVRGRHIWEIDENEWLRVADLKKISKKIRVPFTYLMCVNHWFYLTEREVPGEMYTSVPQ